MASAAPPRLPFLRSPSLLLLLIALLLLSADHRQANARGPPAVTSQPAIFRGSGCRDPAGVMVDTRFDEIGGTIRVHFLAPFGATSGNAGRMTRLACNGVIPLVIDAGKRIGITQVRIAGHVSVGSESSTAQITSEFFFPGDRGPLTQHRFLPQHGSHAFEIDRPSGTIWSRCGGKQTLRVNAALTASGLNTEVVLDDETAHGDGFEYEVTVKDCIADPRREL